VNHNDAAIIVLQDLFKRCTTARHHNHTALAYTDAMPFQIQKAARASHTTQIRQCGHQHFFGVARVPIAMLEEKRVDQLAIVNRHHAPRLAEGAKYLRHRDWINRFPLLTMRGRAHVRVVLQVTLCGCRVRARRDGLRLQRFEGRIRPDFRRNRAGEIRFQFHLFDATVRHQHAHRSRKCDCHRVLPIH
jgi:hypothetical protein